MSDYSNNWFRVNKWMSESKTGLYPTVVRIKANVPEFPYFTHPKTSITVERLFFDEGAILNDAILEGANKNGSVWIVSRKLKELLEYFRLPEHAFYKIEKTIKQGKSVEEDYYIFNIYENLKNKDMIDYSLSEFKTVPYTSFLSSSAPPFEVIIAKSKYDYNEICKEQSNKLNDVQPLKLNLNNEIIHDLFSVGANDYFISKKLAKAFEKSKITGFDLMPIDFKIQY